MISKRHFPGTVLGVAGLVALIVLTIAPTRDDRQVALIFPPWIDAREAVRRTAELELPIIGWGAGHHAVILDVSQEDDARSRLDDARGLVIAAEIAAGCFALAADNQIGQENT